MSKFSDSIVISERIDPKTGKRDTIYTYKRRRCPKVTIPGAIAKSYIGYSLILSDLRDSKLWLEKAYEILPESKAHWNKAGEDSYLQSPAVEDFKIIRSLFYSSIVFYGKCFTQAEGRRIKLEKKQIDGRFLEKHDEVMDMRHNLAAHSGIHRFDSGKLNLILPPKKGTDLGTYLRPELFTLGFFDDREEEVTQLDLISFVIEFVERKKETIGKKIFSDVIRKKPESYWRGKAK